MQVDFAMNNHKVVTKTMMQYQPTECGAASLGTVMGFYGRYIDLKRLREDVKVGRDGSTAGNIVRAGEKYGLDCTAKRLNFEGLRNYGNYPLVAFWKNRHWLVIEGISSKKVFLSDPAQGRLEVNENYFIENYSQIILDFKPNKNFVKGGSPVANWRYLTDQLKGFLPHVAVLYITGIVQALAILYVSGVTSQFINRFLAQTRLQFGVPILWLLFIVVIILFLAQIFSLTLMRRITLVLSKKATSTLFLKLFSVPFQFYITRLQGELSGRFTLVLTLIQQTVNTLLSFSVSLFQAFLVLIGSFFISPQLALITTAVFAINILVNIALTKKRESQNKLLALEQGISQGVCQVIMSDFESIKASGQERLFIEGWQEHFSKYIYENQMLGADIAKNSIISNASNVFVQLILTGIAGMLILSGQLSLGTLVAFQFIVSQIGSTLLQIPTITSQLQIAMGGAGRIKDLYDEDYEDRSLMEIESEVDEYNKDKEDSINHSERVSSISMDEVQLTFAGSSEPFIKNVSFDIQSGSKVAIIGGSGSGKTTLARIIAGLYKPTSGSVRFDNINSLKIDPKIIRSSLAYVSQDVFIFSRSFRENLSLWNPNIGITKMRKASLMADILQTINSKNGTYDYHLTNNGRNLSGGQRQRLEIARALAQDPKILILDEATSALDIKGEKKVLENIFNDNLTVISIAHRLTSAELSDLVIIMENGQIVETGPPELLKQNVHSRYNEMLDADSMGAA
tara:strand:+ start:4853 stop:7072 length:2220 start_codon:yes stop_codon:yes gene_type:complete